MSNAGKERKEVIKMGYLVKSPSRSRDKSSYAIFWKVRWCVLAQVFPPDEGIVTCFHKFFLYYYEDEDSYKQDLAPKGYLDLSQCTRVKSCYRGCAGFSHIFEIECFNGKLVKFSASSCKTKFLWFDALFKHIYRIPIERVKRTKVISQTRRKSDTSDSPTYATDGSILYKKPRSVSMKQPDTESLGFSVKDSSPRSRNDSGFSSSTSSSMSSQDDPPQLPPRRHPTGQESLPSLHEGKMSLLHSSSDDLQLVSQSSQDSASYRSHGNTFSSKAHTIRSGGSFKETRKPCTLELYFYCEECVKCEKSNSLGSRNFKRRPSQKEKFIFNADKLTDIVDGHDSTNGDTEPRIYEEIDTEWLEKVRNMISTSSDQDPPYTEQEVDGGVPLQSFELKSPTGPQAVISEKGVNVSGSSVSQDRLSEQNAVEEIYVRMDYYSSSRSQVLDSDAMLTPDDLYQSMEEMNPVLRDMETARIGNPPRSDSNDNENDDTDIEHRSDIISDALRRSLNITNGINDIEAGHGTEKDIDEKSTAIVEERSEVSAVSNAMKEADFREIEATFIEKEDKGINCDETLQLSQFPEQFNTKL